MSGPEGVSERRTTASLEFYDKPLPKEEERRRANVANAPWALDVEKLRDAAPIPAAVFTNPTMAGPPVALAPPRKAAPPPLAAAPDAYKGIKLAPSAGTLPKTDRTDLTRTITSGPYKLFPAVRKGADGADAIVFYKAVDRESGRAEFIVGPGSLADFQRDVAKYADIGLTTYALGDPDTGASASMRVMETAMDKGFVAAVKELPSAWLEAAKDPHWVAKTVTQVATAAVPASRAEAAAMRKAAEAEAKTATGMVREINIDPGTKIRGTRNFNCANCALATDSTLGGSPASALAGEETKASDVAAHYPGRSWTVTAGPKDIEAALTQAGPGSRGIVFGSRGPTELGHFFNVVNENGTVRFLDGQAGGVANLNLGYVDFFLLRTN